MTFLGEVPTSLLGFKSVILLHDMKPGAFATVEVCNNSTRVLNKGNGLVRNITF